MWGWEWSLRLSLIFMILPVLFFFFLTNWFRCGKLFRFRGGKLIQLWKKYIKLSWSLSYVYASLFMNKVVVFKSKDNAFEFPCNLSQCENVEFCLHNLPRLTQNLQWCLLAPGVTPATWRTYPKIATQPRYQQKHEAPFPLQPQQVWGQSSCRTILTHKFNPCLPKVSL